MQNAFVIVILLCAPVLRAQSSDTELDRRYQQQIFEKWALDHGAGKQDLARRQADAQLREFYTKAHRFVVLWRTFALDLENQKTFNAKLAKQVSKAFHDLEKSDGWPVGRSK